MKTRKYLIEFDGAERLNTEIEITKTQYENNLTQLTHQAKKYNCNLDIPTEIFEEIKETTTKTTYETMFLCGTSRIYLTKIICKKGYKFKEN